MNKQQKRNGVEMKKMTHDECGVFIELLEILIGGIVVIIGIILFIKKVVLG